MGKPDLKLFKAGKCKTNLFLSLLSWPGVVIGAKTAVIDWAEVFLSAVGKFSFWVSVGKQP
jgi:hypothetical protein